MSSTRNHTTPLVVRTAARSTARGTVVTAATLATLAVTALAAPAAGAATDPTLGFGDLGLSDAVSLPGRSATTVVTVPVPDGLTPDTLRGTLQVPATYDRGVLEVVQDGRVLGRATVADGDGASTTPVSIPLAGLTVTDATTIVELRTTLVPVNDGWCHDPLDTVTSTLRDASVSYSGTTGAPETLAEALPPVLRGLTVTVPEDPDDDVIAAALETATAVSAAYRTQHPAIRVHSSADADSATDRDEDADPAFTRRIDIPGDNASGITLDNPGSDSARITLHGTGDALLDQARLLAATSPTDSSATSATGDLAGLLDSTSAEGRGLPVELAPESRTLGDLDLGGLTASGPGATQITFGIGQGDVGRYIDSLNLHLTGSFTPAPADAPAELTVAVNGTVVERMSTADDEDLTSGVLDREVSFPKDIITRYNTVTVTLTGTGDQGCGTTSPLTLRIDGGSVIDTSAADAPTDLTAGFQALPQAFMPEVDVALTTGDVADVDRAARVLAGLQSVTDRRFRPVVTDLGATADSDRPVLIVDADGTATAAGTGDSAQDTGLPVTLADGVLDADGATVATTTTFGALQTSWDTDRHRMRVVANSTGSPGLLDRLLDRLDNGTAAGETLGYGSLNGTAVIQQTDGAPQQIGVPSTGTYDTGDADDATGPDADSDDDGVSVTGVVIAVVAVVVVAALLLTVLGVLSRGGRRWNGDPDRGSDTGSDGDRDNRDNR